MTSRRTLVGKVIALPAVFATACGQREVGEWRDFSATAYAVSGTTASGSPTTKDRSVAADPAILPLGTTIEIRGAGSRYDGIYIVQDTGPAIRGAEVDIFIRDPTEAREFGRKQVQVRVIESAGDREAAQI